MWGGNFVSVVGSQMQMVAINWHIYRLLAGTTVTIAIFGYEIPLSVEALGLGGVGLMRVIPIMLFAVIGGTLADVANRERFREYDYGPGLGFAAEAFYFRNGRPIVDFRYRQPDGRRSSPWGPQRFLHGAAPSDRQLRHRIQLRGDYSSLGRSPLCS